MKNKTVIPPEVINILGSEPEFRAQSSENQPQQPEPPKQSLWQKALALSKEVDEFIQPITAGAAAFALVTNAVARYKKATNAGDKGRGK